MKHAGRAALDDLSALLSEVRVARPDLRERSLGRFYERSRAYLHFHEDPTGLFADVKVAGAWRRIDVTCAAGRRQLVAMVRVPPVTARPTPSGRRRSAAGAPTPSPSGCPGPR